MNLTLSTWTATQAGWKDWWPATVNAFEAQHPGVTVTVNQIDFAGYVSGLTTQLAAGKGPSIIHVPLPLQTLPAWGEAGFLQDLGSLVSSTDIGASWPASQSSFEWNGKTYGVLLQSYGVNLYYNKAMLDAAGLQVPTTTDEFLADAQRLTANGKYGFATSQDNTSSTVTDLLYVVNGQAAPWIKDGAWNFTDPTVVKAFDTWRTLTTKYGPTGTDVNAKRQAYLDGNVAFMFEGPFELPAIPANMKDTLHLAPMPFGHVVGNVSNGLSISAGLNPDTEKVAEEFVQFAASEAPMESLAKATATPGARASANKALGSGGDIDQVVKAAADVDVMMIPSDAQGLRKNYNDFQTAMTDTAQQLLTTSVSTADALKALQDDLKSKGINPNS